jgi:hypothetical protein
LSRNDASTLLPSVGQRLINARDLTNCLLSSYLCCRPTSPV